MTYAEFAALMAGVLAANAFFVVSVLVHEARNRERQRLEEALRIASPPMGASRSGRARDGRFRPAIQENTRLDRMQRLGAGLAVLSTLCAGIYAVL
jgi:hypothetical protein